jgi:hypothetical protein
VAGRDNDLVDPLPFIFRKHVRLGTLGFLVGQAFLPVRLRSA